MVRIAKILSSSVAFLLAFHASPYAQSVAPHIEWTKNFGGSDIDQALSIESTLDKGFIIAGLSYSNDGDVTGHHGTTDFADYWIIKLDSSANLQWQRSLGGDSDDVAYSIKQTPDGGYIVAGYSSSKNGDVSGNHGGSDYWIVRLDDNGTIIWQKSYGGTGNDKAYSVELSADGGYVIAGTSFSNDKDVIGHHGSIDSADCWIIKLNSGGDLEWEKSLGGSEDDQANDIKRTSDNGFVIAAYFNSINDFSTIKIDSLGNDIWESSKGGSGDDKAFSIIVTKDRGFVLAGYSNSINGIVTGNHGNTDFWILKLDSTGNLKWEKSFGGGDADAAYSIRQTFDDGFIIAGNTASNDGDVTGNHGGDDYWVVKLDSLGNLQWQKTLGGSGEDFGLSIIQTSDSGYVVVGSSDSYDRDITNNQGHEDFWIVKLGNKPVSDVNSSANSSRTAINFPNPFSDRTEIQFGKVIELPSEFILYNILGEEVEQMKILPGAESIIFSRGKLISGVYVYHVMSGGALAMSGNINIE